MNSVAPPKPMPQPPGVPAGDLPASEVEPKQHAERASREDEEAMQQAMTARTPVKPGAGAVALSFTDRVEAFIARLSTRNNFWHRLSSMIWLPYAFRSGIRMKRVDEKTFTAVLPFKRFNRNWYNAMAGASLLANSEIAGGMYIFGITGGEYTLVCKQLEYKFLRPCFGPAIYKIAPREDLRELIARGKEFNITLDLDVYQQPLVPQALAKIKKRDPLIAKLASKERRVGACVATFHLTPTQHQKAKRGDTRNVGGGVG